MENKEGYAFEVVGDLINEYQCPICCLLIKESIELPCTHIMCGGCLKCWEPESIERNGELLCPSCRFSYQKENVQRGKAMDRIITTSLKVKCKQHEETCTWIGTISDYKDHEKHCEFHLISCHMDGCDVKVKRYAIEEHITNKCMYRLIECKLCKETLQYLNKEEHYIVCENYPVSCNNENCLEVLQRNKMEDHLQNHCNHQMISCDYHNIGCDVTMKRGELKDHLNNSMQNHMYLMLQYTSNIGTKTENLQATQQKLDVTAEELADTRQRLKLIEEKLMKAENKLVEMEKKENETQDTIERLENNLSLVDTFCSSLAKMNYFSLSLESKEKYISSLSDEQLFCSIYLKKAELRKIKRKNEEHIEQGDIHSYCKDRLELKDDSSIVNGDYDILLKKCKDTFKWTNKSIISEFPLLSFTERFKLGFSIMEAHKRYCRGSPMLVKVDLGNVEDKENIFLPWTWLKLRFESNEQSSSSSKSSSNNKQKIYNDFIRIDTTDSSRWCIYLTTDPNEWNDDNTIVSACSTRTKSFLKFTCPINKEWRKSELKDYIVDNAILFSIMKK